MTVVEDRPALPITQSEFSPADQRRFAHVRRFVDRQVPAGPGPAYDSVVIAGTGIAAYALAARLARSAEFAGKVVVAGPPVQETRQIANGCSMRGIAADFLSYALNCPQADLVRQMTGPHFAGQPVATRQVVAMARPPRTDGGRWGFGPAGSWQGGRRGLSRPIMYGARNSRMANAIYELARRDGFVTTDAAIGSVDEARDLAPGRRPLLVNLSRNPRLFGGAAPKTIGVTLAAQMPLKVGPGGLRKPVAGTTAFAPLVNRGGAINVGYFTPFADPLSPEASWYGLLVRPLRSGIDFDKAHEIDLLAEEVVGIAEAAGLEPVDRDVTQFGGGIPVASFGAPSPSGGDVLEMRRLVTPGAVAYYADGILGGAVGAVVAAEALLRGVDPHLALARAMRTYVWWNRLWWYETTRMAPLVDALLTPSPLTVRLAMAYPHSFSVNHWASRG